MTRDIGSDPNIRSVAGPFSIHRRAQETKASWVSLLHFSVIFLFCFVFGSNFFFPHFNAVSFVFVHVGLLQILELRPKIALRFTWDVDFSTIHGPNYLVISAKARQEFFSAIQEARQEFFSAIQEAMYMMFSNPAKRRYVTQLAMKFHHIWGKLPSI